MTREAILTLIRFSLRRCPRCGYDVSNAVDVVCPECGRNLERDAKAVGSKHASFYTEQWLTTAVLSVLPHVCVFVWAVAEDASHKYRTNSQPKFGMAFMVVLLQVVVVGLIALASHRRRLTTRGLVLFVGVAWLWMPLPILLSMLTKR